MGTLNYNQKAIKKELINLSKDTVNRKTYQMAKLLQIKSGDFYTNEQLKDKLTEIYKTVGINKAAKASDLNEWFETKTAQRTIKNKRVNGVSIVCPKVIVR